MILVYYVRIAALQHTQITMEYAFKMKTISYNKIKYTILKMFAIPKGFL